MITLITGAPGSGKSAALVSLLERIAKGRTIYASGIPDLTIQHEPLDDPSKWPDVVPDGSVVVIDEVQRVWRPRGPGQKVPVDIAALETHRHRGIDFYVVTQSPRLVDTNVRALVGRHVHLRELGMLGRWWYEWPEVSDGCAVAWKNAPIKKRYTLPKAVFGKYKSASEHVKPIRSIPWMVFVLFGALVLTVFFVWKSATVIQEKGLGVGGPKAAAAGAANPFQIGPIGQAQLAAGGHEPKLLDDRVDWIPRVSMRPESAPAYDNIRVVAVMPVVAGGMCMGGKCKCVTQQGTDAGLSPEECKRWIDNPPFDPYARPQQQAGMPHGGPIPAQAGPAVPQAATVAPAPFQLPPESSRETLQRIGALPRNG
jgi:zona occludens toxin